MSVIWDEYRPFIPGVDRPLHELPRKEARGAYDRLMAAKDARIHALETLLHHNELQLKGDEGSLQQLNDWFRENVEEDPNNPGRLAPIWYSVVNDIALYLGDWLIKRAKNLHWTFYSKGRRDLSYQRHVIMGFSKVKDKNYHVDLDYVIGIYGHRIVGRMKVESDLFVQIVRSVLAKA